MKIKTWFGEFWDFFQNPQKAELVIVCNEIFIFFQRKIPRFDTLNIGVKQLAKIEVKRNSDQDESVNIGKYTLRYQYKIQTANITVSLKIGGKLLYEKMKQGEDIYIFI